MSKIAVILPSRGLIYAEVEDAIQKNLSGYDYSVYRSWDLVIPDSFNVLVDRALAMGAEYLLFVEEDTVMPDGAVLNLLTAKSDIACIDYSVNGYSCVARDKNTNDVLWCGLGCTLVKREVFLMLEKPYFRSDKALLLNYWPEVRWIDAGAQAYGGQDIYFCITARQRGFKITQVAGECKHLKLESLGRAEINKGLHQIGTKGSIKQQQYI